ncbi:MAG TPA: GTPase HflX [Candidatus Omnitrophota bacterium]|nr:GTPase HflX [Candidatus Omnitrophota bacterium]
MYQTKPVSKERERAILVTVTQFGKDEPDLDGRIEEFKTLASSCGAVIAGSEICRIKEVKPDLFIGKGKAEEIALKVAELKAGTVIFNNDLSPSQQKNLSEKFNAKTIDRTQLILDVFARRATSLEGKVQVELAQLEYLLPRLSRLWLHFSKQAGGIGTKGPGEQQLEEDRRKVRERISRLKKELKEITSQRQLRRSRREKFSMLSAALVGYTNSGKSTLFNAITSAEVKTKDQFFSTLDPTVRKKVLSNNQIVLFSDTVGFLNDLPHHLIESFKATLEEVVEADVLFHVVDMNDERMDEKTGAVIQVLNDIGVADKPSFTVLNKSDLVPDGPGKERIKRKFDRPIVVSALKKEGLSAIDDLLTAYMRKDMEEMEIVLPHKHYSAAAIIRERGEVLSELYREDGLYIKARVPKKVKNQIFKTLKK